VVVAYLKILWNFLLEGDGSHYNAVKCKTIPLQAWAGPEVSWMLRLPDFKTVGT
jgi:hypothetical protein